MPRLCERPACSEPGAIAYGFDPARLLVWLTPLDPDRDSDRHRAGVLCLRHADSMVVPVGWTLDDLREPSPQLFRPPRQPRQPRSGRSRRRKPPAEPAPTEQLRLPDSAERTVAAVTGVAAATGGDPDATVAIPWLPEFDDAELGDLRGVLDAKSPLLRRAFRGSRDR